MALIFVDGFDTYSTANITTELAAAGWTTTGNIATGTGRVAGNSIRGGGTDATPTYVFTTTSTAYCGYAIQFNSSTALTLTSFRDTTGSGNAPLTLGWRNGGILVTLNNGVTISATPGNIMPGDSVFRHVAISVNSNNTTGSYKVLVEGVTVLQATGVDTAVSTVGILTQVVAIAPQSGAIDDFYLGDATGPAPYNALLGDCRVETLRPTTDAAVAWIQSAVTANNASLVANVSTSVLSYVQTSLSATRDSYNFGDIVGIPVTVYAVIPTVYQQKLDAGTMNIRTYLSVNGATTVGAAISPLVSTLRWSQQIFTTQPGGTAWNSTAVNNLVAGFETI